MKHLLLKYTVKSSSFLLILSLSLISCGGLKTIEKVEKSYPVLSKTESFRLFDLTDRYAYKPDEVIGEIKIKDAGLAIICDYETVIQKITERAKIMGANALQITEHKKPDAWSSCHRVTAKALRLKEAWRYEKEIAWHKDRKLKIRDFKGDTTNHDAIATTSSGFGMRFSGSPIKKYGLIDLDVVFYCENSYFTHTPDSLFTLEHEQIHFDITELYARIFLQKAEQEFTNFQDFTKNYQKLWDKVQLEWRMRQKNYDIEIQSGYSNQKKWTEGVTQQLKDLKKYESRQLKLPFRKVKQE